MRQLILLLLFLSISLSSSAQEKYFHELRGMEDSTGTTHLFYRMYERIPFQCSEESGGELIFTIYNNVFHINTSTVQDSVKFRDYFSPWCLYGLSNFERTAHYDFYENDPTKWIIQSNTGGCFPYPVSDYKGRVLKLPGGCIIKQNPLQRIEFNGEDGFLLSNKYDSLYFNERADGGGFRVAIKDDFSPNFFITTEEEYAFYYNYMDSIWIPFGVAEIHPTVDSLFYSKNYSGHLLASEKYSSSFELADTTASFYKLVFDSDSSVLYSIVTTKQNDEFSRELKRSTNFGRAGSWIFQVLPEQITHLEYLVTDSKKPGNLFIADSSTVFRSENFGDSFEPVFETSQTIQGIYKKPGFDLFYVLTTEELFQVENGAITSLKKLPVSNEEESKVIPNSIVLLQNYPNPFNPSTTISFELDSPAEITLTVFDALGRTISTLVNERKPSGLHQITFDASNLSSGIYFYRLETENFIETKRLTLIK